ncbi:MAG: AMP-binding protein [Aquabacterium sp.]
MQTAEDGLITASVPLLQRWHQQVQARPRHMAFIDGPQAIDHAALWVGAMAWCARLSRHMQAGDRVALLMDNSARTASVGYGAWAAGGVWVALNTALKPDDLLWQLQHCGAKVLVHGDKYAAVAEKAAALGIQVLPNDACDETLADPSIAPAFSAFDMPDATQAAAIIYTSGTTGKPKGVMLTHGNLAANVSAIQQTLPMQADDVTLCLLPFFYAFGFSVLHTHLTLGATLVLQHSLMYPQQVLQKMAETHATAFYGVPSSYYLLMERGQLAQARLPSLRYVAQAGGAMDAARIDEVRRLLPGVDFYVMYGQTEACSRLTTLPAHRLSDKPGSVGLPLPGVALSIQSEQGALLPAGQTGEVCAQGANVMAGYWQAPQDTAATLQHGWLRTGDLGHLDEEGFLFLTGRLREQIKTGAHRVSPWEIEEVIRPLAGVREVAAIGAPDPLLGETVHVFVMADAPSDALRRIILQTCKAQLASYKVPKAVSFLSDFPRTASGKVQKHLLAATLATPPAEPTSHHDA